MTLSDASISTSLVSTCLAAISWPDSPASSRSCSLLEVMLPRLVEQGSLGQEDASSLMMTVLKAFQVKLYFIMNYIEVFLLVMSNFVLCFLSKVTVYAYVLY